MEADDESPQIKGVVIISLPPPDNPSLGKTITAFTFSNPSQPSPQPHQQHQTHHHTDPPIQSYPSNPQLQFSLRRLFHTTPIKLFSFFGVLLFALFLYGSLFSTTTTLELRGPKNDDDGEPSSFLFPLFPKYGVLGQRDLRLKLGKLLGVQKQNFLKPKSAGGVASSSSSVIAVDSSSTVFPISGNVYPEGLYYTHLRVGNPPKHYFVDVDTGSDLTWIQCDAPCRSCAKGAHVLYKPTRSNIVPSVDAFCLEVQKSQKNGYYGSFQQCDYEIQYADHSSSLGVLIRDELHLTTTNGSKTKFNFVFGCGYDQEGLLLNTLVKTDGIMGLGRARVGLPYQLASKGLIKNVVGHCLSNDGVGGGYMFLGDDFVPYWGMTWVPMVHTTDLYQTEILGINYGNRPLSFDGHSKVGKVVFDSGSSYTYFPKEAYMDLVASLKEVSGLGLIQDDSDTTLPICWQANFPIRSVKDVKDFFKTLTLRFGSKWWILSTLFQIAPEGYLIISNKGNVCLAILDGSSVNDGSSIILGGYTRMMSILSKLFSRSLKASTCKELLRKGISEIGALKTSKTRKMTTSRCQIAQELGAGQVATSRCWARFLILEKKRLVALDMLLGFCQYFVSNSIAIELNGSCPSDLKCHLNTICFGASRFAELRSLHKFLKQVTSKYSQKFTRSSVELERDSDVDKEVIELLASTVEPPKQEINELLTAIAAEYLPEALLPVISALSL